MSINVHIEKFEGPMGLLLHLIRREEMDIFDINIHQITQQYMDYIRAMKKFDLERAGEFVAMAATLIQIKSRMLLPQYGEDGEIIDDIEDPRKELVQRLLDYQKFQDASQRLYERPLLGRDVWLRGSRVKMAAGEEEIEVEENALFALIKSYRMALHKMKSSVHKVMGELQSISERILEMRNQLQVGIRASFFSLAALGPEHEPQVRANRVLITFLSLLELTRMGFVSVFQSENFEDIHIDTKREIDRDVVSRAESFESADTEAMAEALIMNTDVTIPADMDFEDDDGEPIEINAEVVVAQPKEQEFEIEAATDDEIELEEKRLSLEADESVEDETLVAEPTVVEPVNEVMSAQITGDEHE